jgi:plastocyanin
MAPSRPLRGRASTTIRRAGLVLCALLIPTAAFAAVTAKGRVEGTSQLLNPVWNEAKEKTSHRYNFREPSPTVRPDVRVLTGFLPKELCIVALGEGAKARPEALRVSLLGGRFSPVTLVVPQGQAIQFENRDPFPHRIFTVGQGGLPAGEIQPTKTRAWTPPGPGKYELRDELAPSVRGWVVVEPKAVAVAYPNRAGEFAISLEPGSYTLRGFFNGEAVGKELPVTIAPAPLEQLVKDALIVGEKPKGEEKPKAE